MDKTDRLNKILEHYCIPKWTGRVENKCKRGKTSCSIFNLCFLTHKHQNRLQQFCVQVFGHRIDDFKDTTNDLPFSINSYWCAILLCQLFISLRNPSRQSLSQSLRRMDSPRDLLTSKHMKMQRHILNQKEFWNQHGIK